MALFNIKNLMDNVSKSTEGIKKSISDAAEKLPDSAKNFNLADSVKDMRDKGQETMESLSSKGEETVAAQTEKIGDTKSAVKDALAEQKSKEAVLPVRDALQVMYCLMAGTSVYLFTPSRSANAMYSQRRDIVSCRYDK